MTHGTVGQGRSGHRTVAVVSDGSTLTGRRTSVETVLHEYSTLDGLPASVGAVFLPHVTPERARAARLAAGETPVVTEHQTSGVHLDVEVYHACALALVMATPPGERLPQGPAQ